MRVRRWAVGRAGVGIWIAASMVALAPRGAAGEVLGQWSSNGPGGASILTLATDPQSPSTVYAGSNGPGVFVSSNGGGSWVPINTGLTNTLIRALGVDPQVPATLYAHRSRPAGAGRGRHTCEGDDERVRETALSICQTRTLAAPADGTASNHILR